MNKNIFFLFFSWLCLWVMPGQARPLNSPNRLPPAELHCNWLVRMTQTEEFRKQVNTTEDQEKNINKRLSKYARENRKIEENIRALARRQAKLFKSLVSSDSPEEGNEQKIYAIIDQISQLRSRQAKLSLKSILELRETLDKEQWKKANEFIRKRNRARMMQRKRANHPNRPIKRDGTGMGNRKFSPNNNGQGYKGRQFRNQDSMDQPVNER